MKNRSILEILRLEIRADLLTKADTSYLRNLVSETSEMIKLENKPVRTLGDITHLNDPKKRYKFTNRKSTEVFAKIKDNKNLTRYEKVVEFALQDAIGRKHQEDERLFFSKVLDDMVEEHYIFLAITDLKPTEYRNFLKGYVVREIKNISTTMKFSAHAFGSKVMMNQIKWKHITSSCKLNLRYHILYRPDEIIRGTAASARTEQEKSLQTISFDD